MEALRTSAKGGVHRLQKGTLYEAGHLIDGDSFLVMLASLLRSAHHGTLGPFFENLRQEYQERRKFVNIFQRKLVAPFVRRVCTITWVGGSYTHTCSPIEVH